MFQLNTFRFWLFSKEKIILFTKHMRIQSRSYNKNKRSFSINPLAPHSSRIRKILFKFEFVHLESEFFYFIFIYLFYWFWFISYEYFSLSFFILFLKSHRFDPLELDSFSHWAKGTKQIRLIKSTMWNIRFFPLPLSHRYSVWINREPFLLSESILFHSNSFPIPLKENIELDPKLTG
jgi:hypothetical protein